MLQGVHTAQQRFRHGSSGGSVDGRTTRFHSAAHTSASNASQNGPRVPPNPTSIGKTTSEHGISALGLAFAPCISLSERDKERLCTIVRTGRDRQQVHRGAGQVFHPNLEIQIAQMRSASTRLFSNAELLWTCLGVPTVTASAPTPRPRHERETGVWGTHRAAIAVLSEVHGRTQPGDAHKRSNPQEHSPIRATTNASSS
jgi:hypothetical protein